MRSEASFAALCGASPVQASSGQTIRHRLNRGGYRQANNALWRIATTRMRYDQTTIAYTQKRRAEGKTRKEIIRCLKRHIAREIYHLLTNPPPTPNSNDLRTLRQHHPHPRRPCAPNPHHPPLPTRTRPPPQPPPRHPIPTMAHQPHTPPKLDLTTIGASTPRTTPHRRHQLARNPTTPHQNPLSPLGHVEPY